MRNPLREIIQDSLSDKENVEKTYYGILGNGSVVDVPNRAGYVYVTLNDGIVTQAFNAVCPSILNYPVVVGYDKLQANKAILTVLTPRTIPRVGATSDNSYNTHPHHATHEWMNSDGNTDVVYVQTRQLMPLRPTPMEGWYLYINPDIQKINGSWSMVGDQTFYMFPRSVNSYTSGIAGDERFVLVSLNSTSGSIQFTNGNLKAIGTTTVADIPATPTGNVPICAIRFWTGQTDITEGMRQTDLADLRMAAAATQTVPHASTHETGSDPVRNIALDAWAATSDISRLNASGSAHGLLPKLSGVSTSFLDGTGNWSVPAGSGSGASGGGGSGAQDVYWDVDGTIVSGSAIMNYVAARPLTIGQVYLFLRNTGASGSTIIDVNINGTSIFTTQAKRPVVASGGGVGISGNPDVNTLSAGGILSFDIDSAAAGAREMSVVVSAVSGSGGAGGGGHTIQNSGSAMPARTYLNFVGSGVSVTDDGANNATLVTVTPGALANLISNGAFSSGSSGWSVSGAATITISGSAGRVSRNSAAFSPPHAYQDITVVIGGIYLIYVDYVARGDSNIGLEVSTTQGAAEGVFYASGTSNAPPRPISGFVQATSTTIRVGIHVTDNAAGTVDVDNISMYRML